MDSDIVERLRGAASKDYGCQCVKCEAADEIERLRAELAAAIKHRDGYLALLDKALSVIAEANEIAAQYKQERDEATAWRPIETAPMDGTVVLLYGDGRVTAGSWIREREVMESTYHHTTGAYLGSFPSGEIYPAYWESHDGGFTEEHPPTHWMPLPQPPRENEGGGA